MPNIKIKFEVERVDNDIVLKTTSTYGEIVDKYLMSIATASELSMMLREIVDYAIQQHNSQLPNKILDVKVGRH